MTTAVELASSSSVALATSSAAGFFSRTNPAARNAGSFAAAMGTSGLSTPSSNEAVASASVTDTGSSQPPAGKATAANFPGTTKVSQKNNQPAVTVLAFASFLPVPVPVLAAFDKAPDIGPQPTLANLSSAPATGANIADAGTTGASQIPQRTSLGFAALLPTTRLPANPSLSVALPSYALTSPSAGAGKEAAATQPISLSLRPSFPPLTSNPAQQPILEANSQEPTFDSAILQAQTASSLTAAAPDIPISSQLTIAAGADSLPLAISANASLVVLQPADSTTSDLDRSSVQCNGAGSAAASTGTAETRSSPAANSGDLVPSNLLSSAMLSPQVPPGGPTPEAAPSPSSLTLSVGARQFPSLAPTLLNALHTLVNNALARANQTHTAPPQSDAPPATTHAANSSANFSIAPALSPVQKLGLSAEQNFSLGNNAGQSPAVASSSLSIAGIPATGAAENNSQSGSSGGDTTDPSLHKALASPGAQSGGPAPASPQLAAALANPALQAPIQGTSQGAMQGTLQGSMPGTIQGTIQAAAGQPAPSSAAHKSDIGAAPSDSPPNLQSPAESPAPASTGPVQMAQMVSKAAQSEMRIGMNTTAFGNVEIHTVVHANEVGIQIGSEKGDLRSLLANELPGIANTLQQQNLRLNQVNFHQQGFAFSNQMSSGGGDDSQSRYFAAKSPATSAFSGEVSSAELGEAAQPLPAADVRGLSVLA